MPMAMAAVPRPKSPPASPDPCGRHRMQLAIDALHREIGFLEDEIKSVEGVHPASKCCKEVDEFIARNTDPFTTISSEKRNADQSHYFLKKPRARTCLSYLSWICCCGGCFSSSQLKRPSCCCGGGGGCSSSSQLKRPSGCCCCCSCGALERLCRCRSRSSCLCCRCRVGCASCCRPPCCCSPCSVQCPRCSCDCTCPCPRCSCACPRCSGTGCIPRCCLCS